MSNVLEAFKTILEYYGCYFYTVQMYGNTAKKGVRGLANRNRYSAVSKETLRKNLCVKVVNLISIHAVTDHLSIAISKPEWGQTP